MLLGTGLYVVPFVLGLTWLSSHPNLLFSLISQGTGLFPQASNLKVRHHSFRYLRIEADHIKVYGDRTHPPVVEIKKLSLVWDLYTIFSGILKFKELLVEEPDIALNVSEEGDLRLGYFTVLSKQTMQGESSFFKVRLERFFFGKGSVKIFFPSNWNLSPFQLQNLESQTLWKNDLEQLTLDGSILWKEKYGKINFIFNKDQDHWKGGYQIDLPLDPLFIPKIDQVSDAMPITGILNLVGSIHLTADNEWLSQFQWHLHDAILLNPQFPNGALKISETDAYGNFYYRGEKGTLKTSVTRTQGPFGNLKGDFSLFFDSKHGPRLKIHVHDNEWSIEPLKPYLLGFLPFSAREWVQEHLHAKGVAKNIDFQMDWNILDDSDDPGTTLSLNADLAGISVSPYETFPAIQQGLGTLHLDLDWLTIQLQHAELPGITSKKGLLRIGYGIPNTTPLEIDIEATGDLQTGWLPIAAVWSDQVPILKQLRFEGNSDILFHLKKTNLSGPEPLELEVEVKPQLGKLVWTLDDRSYILEQVSGVVKATLDGLIFNQVHFSHGEIFGEVNGELRYHPQDPAKMKLSLHHLESLMPQPPTSSHRLKHWLPETLSANIDISRPYDSSLTEFPWKFEVMTIDSENQSLYGEVNWDTRGVRVNRINGTLGKLEFQGDLDFTNGQGLLSLQIDESPKTPHSTIRLSWKQNQRFLNAQLAQLYWDDFVGWTLPPALTEWLPKEESITTEQWTLDISASQGFLSPQVSLPFVMRGVLMRGSQYQLDTTLQIGKDTGRLAYEGSLEKGKLSLNWNAMDFGFWLNQVLLQPPSMDLSEPKFFKHLSIEANIAAFKIPGNQPVPLKYGGIWERSALENRVDISQLDLGSQRLSGNVKWNATSATLKMNSSQMELLPWTNWMRSYQFPETSSQLAQVHFEIQTDKLMFNSQLQLPAAVHGVIELRPNSEQEKVISVENFSMGHYSGSGTLGWKPGHSTLHFSAPSIALYEHLGAFAKIPWIEWVDSTIVSLPNPIPHQVHFLFEVPQLKIKAKKLATPFRIEGVTQFGPNGTQIDVSSIRWGQQQGVFSVQLSPEKVATKGKFKYLNLQLWDELTEAFLDSKENVGKNALDPLAFQIPKREWDLDLSADVLKLLNSSFDHFHIAGEGDAQNIKLSEMTWKRKDTELFHLSGELSRVDNDSWKGSVSTKIADLGDVMELLSREGASVQREYPLEKGVSKIQADIELKRIDSNYWLPYADINFYSKDGIIRKGKALGFLLAILSVESYYSFVKGDLSTFRGKGMVYKTIDSHLKMKGSQFEIYKLDISTEVTRIMASGTFNYATDAQQLLFCLQPFKTVDKVLRVIPILNWVLTSRRGAFFEVCLNTSGSFAEPSLFLLPQSLLPGRLRDVAIFDYDQLEGAKNNSPSADMLSPLSP